MKFVLDTNILILALDGKLASPLPFGEQFISTTTLIEVLSYPGLERGDIDRIETFLEKITIVPVDEAIARLAAGLRRTRSLKLPDAVICSTAIAFDAVLLSNDRQLHNIDRLVARALEML